MSTPSPGCAQEQRKTFRIEWEWPASVKSDSTDELISSFSRKNLALGSWQVSCDHLTGKGVGNSRKSIIRPPALQVSFLFPGHLFQLYPQKSEPGAGNFAIDLLRQRMQAGGELARMIR